MNSIILILWVANLVFLSLNTWVISRYLERITEINNTLWELGREVRSLEGWINLRTSNIHVGHDLKTTEKGDYESEV